MILFSLIKSLDIDHVDQRLFCVLTVLGERPALRVNMKKWIPESQTLSSFPSGAFSLNTSFRCWNIRPFAGFVCSKQILRVEGGSHPIRYLWVFPSSSSSSSPAASASVRVSVLLVRRAAVARGQAAAVVVFKRWQRWVWASCDELTESSSADQSEPVELEGPEQSSPQVTLPRGHQGHRVHRDGSIPETRSRGCIHTDYWSIVPSN